MQEIWKDIKGYEGLYQISNLGRIKSLDKKDSIGRKIKGKLMRNIVRKDGYFGIILSKDGKAKDFLIHRLVAQAFVLNKDNYKEVNHKDECKQNNNATNLEWCNRKYNVNYGNANKERRKTLLNRNGKKIKQYDKNRGLIEYYESLGDANRKTGINISHISQCCNKKRKTAGGYIWEYV
jgi:hypothetical protein